MGLQAKSEWVYVAAEPDAISFGPIKIGWTGRSAIGAALATVERTTVILR
jgi:hypothetical protein